MPPAARPSSECPTRRPGHRAGRACDTEDVDRAVASARAAFESGVWSGLAPRQRRVVLQRLARVVEEHAEELALLEGVDMGKPYADALAVDLRVSVQTLDFYAGHRQTCGEVAPTALDTFATITREPLGVVGAVVPWNFPLMMAIWKVAPALARSRRRPQTRRTVTPDRAAPGGAGG